MTRSAIQTEVDETLVTAPLAEVEQVPAVQEITVEPTTKSVRVKGTWTMYWGLQVWDFSDGQRYDLPIDLFSYLRERGNIYDTM